MKFLDLILTLNLRRLRRKFYILMTLKSDLLAKDVQEELTRLCQ